MNFTLTITASPELLETIRLLAGGFKAPATAIEPVTPTAVNGSASKTRSRSNGSANGSSNTAAVATQDLPRVEDPAVAEAAEQKPEEVAEGVGPVTIETIRATVQEKAQGGKRTQVKDLLAKYEAANVSALPEDKFSAFYKEVAAL